MKNILNGFSRGFGYTLGRIVLYVVLSYFILSNLRGCDNEKIKVIFDAVLT
jgi:hypothetical protein